MDDEVALTEDEIGNLFQDTSSEEELGKMTTGKLIGFARRTFFAGMYQYYVIFRYVI